MLGNVIVLAFLLLTVSANSPNSFPKRLSTEKPNILLEDPPFASKSINKPTHISEFTDPDTGLNPFLDLEEGPTFMGRNVMKDETREHPKETYKPFMDFEMVEGDSDDRRRQIELDFSKKSMEETFTMWVPFEKDEDTTSKEESTTSQPRTTVTYTTMPPVTTQSEEELIFYEDDFNDAFEKQIRTQLGISTVSTTTVICILASIGIILIVFFTFLFSCYWRKKIARTSRLPTTAESEGLKC